MRYGAQLSRLVQRRTYGESETETDPRQSAGQERNHKQETAVPTVHVLGSGGRAAA